MIKKHSRAYGLRPTGFNFNLTTATLMFIIFLLKQELLPTNTIQHKILIEKKNT